MSIQITSDIFNEAKELILNNIESFPSTIFGFSRKTIRDSIESPFERISKNILPAIEHILNNLIPPARLIQGGFIIENNERKSMEVAVEWAAKASGRIERKGKPIGTAWMVRDGIAVTNSHVAENFSHQEGGSYSCEENIYVDFKAEYNSEESLKFKVSAVLYLRKDQSYDEPDIALLRLEKNNRLPVPIKLSVNEGTLENRKICTIGFPSEPTPTNSLIRYILNGFSGFKRVSYGKIKKAINSDIFIHNCTSFKGSSGACIIDYTNNEVVGIHTGSYDHITSYRAFQLQLYKKF
jgi:V8-like Glu-specific endopeptidase